jgi:hypothetical protein
MMRLQHGFFFLCLVATLIFFLTNWRLWDAVAPLEFVGFQADAPVIRYILIASIIALAFQYLLAVAASTMAERRMRDYEHQMTLLKAQLFERSNSIAVPPAPATPVRPLPDTHERPVARMRDGTPVYPESEPGRRAIS